MKTDNHNWSNIDVTPNEYGPLSIEVCEDCLLVKMKYKDQNNLFYYSDVGYGNKIYDLIDCKEEQLHRLLG